MQAYQAMMRKIRCAVCPACQGRHSGRSHARLSQSNLFLSSLFQVHTLFFIWFTFLQRLHRTASYTHTHHHTTFCLRKTHLVPSASCASSAISDDISGTFSLAQPHRWITNFSCHSLNYLAQNVLNKLPCSPFTDTCLQTLESTSFFHLFVLDILVLCDYLL